MIRAASARRSALTAALALALAAPLLSGCSDAARPQTGSGSAEQHAAEHSGEAVRLTDGWAKSADAGGMTGVFGTLENRGDEDLTITGVESDAAEHVELHEVTTSGVMQPFSGEARIPAGGDFELAPGANHVMLMGLTRELLAGDEVRFTVRFSDDTSAEFAALVKDYSGANENYGGEHDGAGADMDAGHDEHDSH